MCTLIIAHRAHAQAPVVVLANRDEFLSRPSHPPALRPGTPPVFCGLDQKEGGTWMGINAFGLVVGLTNLTLRPPDPARRSRGLLCMDMLRRRSAQEVREALDALPSAAYNPFNLVALDGTSAVRVRYDEAPRVQELEPGVHGTTNWPEGTEPDAKRMASEGRVRALLGAASGWEEIAAGLRAEARRHDGDRDPRVSVCCHAPGYGTRASTVVLLDPAGGRVRVMHSDGAPCETPYADRSGEVAPMLSFKEF